MDCPEIMPRNNRCFADMRGKCITPSCPHTHSKFNKKSAKACQVRLKRKDWCEAAYTPEGCRSNHNFKYPAKIINGRGAATITSQPRQIRPSVQVAATPLIVTVFLSKIDGTDRTNKIFTTDQTKNHSSSSPTNPLHSAVMGELTLRMTSMANIRYTPEAI
jgi:hypothetical protein